MERFIFILKEKINDLPQKAGVYAFKSNEELLYIGKAVNIRNRVKNHFQQPSYRDDLFIGKVKKIGFIKTDSEIEALILEANLIKNHQPKFNVVWRDDKNYFYVALAPNKDRVAYVFITHQPKNKFEIKYVGPFVEGNALKKTLRFLRRVFPYYTSSKHPKIKCTYCHLGLCPGPDPDLKQYKKNIKKLTLILEGKRSAVLNSLKKEMQKLSKESKFEEAAEIRDRISNLQQVMSHARVLEQPLEGRTLQSLPMSLAKIIGTDKPVHRIECYDVSNIQGKFATGSMAAFINGKADKNFYRKFKIKMKAEPNDIAMLKETLERRFAHPEWQYPEIILIDGGIAQLNVAIFVKNQKEETKNIKVISIAKRNKDLYIGNKDRPIPLKTLPQEIYNLIINLDDEAHRFAITYHKKLRKKSLLQ